MKSSYIAFYTTKPFWAGSPLNLSKPETQKYFTSQMGNVVFSYENKVFEFKVCRDGMLMFRIHNLEAEIPSHDHADINTLISWWSRYIKYANCLHLLLDSCVVEVEKLAYLELFEITNKDVIRIVFEDGKMIRTSIPSESLVSIFQMLRYPLAIPFETLLQCTNVENRIPLRKAIFDLTAEKFSYVAGEEVLVDILSRIAKSIAEYKVGNYSTSVALSWFAIESIINQKWQRFLDDKGVTYNDGSKRINSKRRECFNGRDYPISVIINVLELSDSITFSLFKDIDTVRGYRNNIVHQEEEYVCEPKHCELAIQTALKLALEGYQFTITPNLNFSIQGP